MDDSSANQPEIDALLKDHFRAGSDLCRVVECEQARALLTPPATHDAPEIRHRASPAGEAGVLVAEPKAWESGFFECPVFQLSLFAASSNYTARRESAEALLRGWIHDQPAEVRAYLVVRIAAEDVAFAHALERQSFSLLVPMVTMERYAAGIPLARMPDHIEAGSVKPDEVVALGAIARDAFVYGRFWIEPRLPHEVAGQMHEAWARNCCTTPLADDVLVARVGAAPAGFIAMRTRSYGHVSVDEINLIAVDASHRGRGLGRLLVEAGRHWSQERSGRLVVRTELPNATAVRLYEGCGFRLGNGSLYYRRWLEPDRRTSDATGIGPAA